VTQAHLLSEPIAQIEAGLARLKTLAGSSAPAKPKAVRK
jgi:hypothetical protein